MLASALRGPRRGIAVRPHDEHVAQPLRLLQTAHVADVQHVKVPVGEDEDVALSSEALSDEE